MVGNHFPQWETISHGGKPFPTVGNHFPPWEIIFHRGISCLPSLQTPIHRDIHKGGAAEGRPSFVEAAGGRLPYGWVSGG